VLRYFQLLLVFVLPMAEASPLPSYSIKQNSDTITISPNLTEDCNGLPAVTERFSRQLLHRDKSTNAYSIIVQDFEVGTGCFEGYSPANISLAAFPIEVNSGKVGSAPSWTLKTHGMHGEPEYDFGPAEGLYRIDLPGCCAARNTFDYVSLDTGKIVASTTGPMLEVVFRDKDQSSGSRPRLVAFEDANASFPLAKAESTEEIAAALIFSDYREIKEAVGIMGARCTGGATNVLMNFAGLDQLETVIVESPVSKKPFNAIVNLTLDCDENHVEMTLPVLPSGLDIANAKLKGAAGIHLEHVRIKSVPQND